MFRWRLLAPLDVGREAHLNPRWLSIMRERNGLSVATMLFLSSDVGNVTHFSKITTLSQKFIILDLGSHL